MLLFAERFENPKLDQRLTWLNPPAHWRVDPATSSLVVETDAPTDFWQKTHYGFAADNGHLLALPVTGDFVMTANVRFHPVHQYDQAGLMLRVDETCWLKTSVEYELADPPQLGVVVTNNGYSDWSNQDFDRNRNEIWLRIEREANDCTVRFSLDGTAWTTLRVAHLHTASNVADCGLYACSPKGTGFRAEFRAFEIETPQDSLKNRL